MQRGEALVSPTPSSRRFAPTRRVRQLNLVSMALAASIFLVCWDREPEQALPLGLEEGIQKTPDESFSAFERAIALRYLHQSASVWQHMQRSTGSPTPGSPTLLATNRPAIALEGPSARQSRDLDVDPDAPEAHARLSDQAARHDLDGYFSSDMEEALRTKRFLRHHYEDYAERKRRQQSDAAFSTKMARAREAQIPAIVEKEREEFESRLHKAFRDNARDAREEREERRDKRDDIGGHKVKGLPSKFSVPPTDPAKSPPNKAWSQGALRDTVIQGRSVDHNVMPSYSQPPPFPWRGTHASTAFFQYCERFPLTSADFMFPATETRPGRHARLTLWCLTFSLELKLPSRTSDVMWQTVLEL